MAELSTLARPYAKAAFEFAVGVGYLDKWSQDLGLLAAVVSTEKVAKLLDSPSLSAAQKASTLAEICGDEISDNAQWFVKALADNRRLLLLPTIVELFEQYKANREKSVEVEVATAFAIDEAAETKLAAALSAKLEREVKLSSSVDESLIGGVVIRAADVVIDASIRGRLSKLAEAMKS